MYASLNQPFLSLNVVSKGVKAVRVVLAYRQPMFSQCLYVNCVCKYCDLITLFYLCG